MQVELVSPEDITYSGEAEMVIVRTLGGGDIAFQPGHVPFIGVLEIWDVRIMRPDGEDHFAVHQGFVQVAGDKVTILSDVSERAEQIDVARAREARSRALAAGSDDADAVAALRRADTRLRVAGATVDH